MKMTNAKAMAVGAALGAFLTVTAWASVPATTDFDATYFRTNALPISLVGSLTNWAKLSTNASFLSLSDTNAFAAGITNSAKAYADAGLDTKAASFTTGAGVTNIGNVLTANLEAGSNVTLSTNAGGAISIASSGGGETPGYYVDSVKGRDSNAGTSSSSPLRTLAALSTYTLIGSNIFLARGSVFRESFQVPNNSYVRAYGVGPNPIISGADLLSNQAFTKTANCTNTYQVSLFLTPETNSYAVIVQTNVLMVWEADKRMGLRFDHNLGAGSTNNVDGNPGSFFFDTTNRVLYIHAADNSDPRINGRVYEASTRTLALHGGDGFTVEDVTAEKAYAYTDTGQQGYAIMGYDGGTYRRCTGRYSWNHCVGVANGRVSNQLTFDSCYGYDMEVYSYAATGTVFVGFKDGATPSVVVFTNCVAAMPNLDTTYQSSGFFCHDSGADPTPAKVTGRLQSCTAINCYYGFQVTPTRPVELTSCTAINCFAGAFVNYQGESFTNFSTYGCTYGIMMNSVTNVIVNNSKFVMTSSVGCISLGNTAGDAAYVTNCIFGNLSGNLGYAIAASGNNPTFYSISNNFFGMQYVYDGGKMGAADYNNYYNQTRYASDQTPSPGYYLTWSNWTNAWPGIEAHSTLTNQNYPRAFFWTNIVNPVQQ